MRILADAVGDTHCDGPYIQPAGQYTTATEHLTHSKNVMFTILDNLVTKNLSATR